MIVLFQRTPRPNAPWWWGRELLAALDAALWPLGWIAAVLATPLRDGVVGLVVLACALLALPVRLNRAIFENERYWFTTWRWGRAIVVLGAVGAIMKVFLQLMR